MTSPRKPSVRKRTVKTSDTPPKDEAAMEEYFNNVEAIRPDEMTLQQRIDKRAQGRYFNATSFRTTEQQKELLKFAASRSGKSVQQYMEDILMAELEHSYGQDFDAQR